MDIEIGRAKRARRAYSFDDVAIVPSRRTRDPEEVSVAWQIDAYRFELPIMAAPMDSVMSPETAVAWRRSPPPIPSWNGQKMEQVYPWGTVRTPTPEANTSAAIRRIRLRRR